MANWNEHYEGLFFLGVVFFLSLICYLSYLCINLVRKILPKWFKLLRNLCPGSGERRRGKHRKVGDNDIEVDFDTELAIIGDSCSDTDNNRKIIIS